MKALLLFGDFRLMRDIPPGEEYQPIQLPHPLGRISFNVADIEHLRIEPLKIMRFEYTRRLDADVLEYEFVGES